MSHFIDSEAEVSDDEEEEEYADEEKRRLKKLKTSQVMDSSEEEEDDEEKIREENKGFINDDDDEEDDEGPSDSDSDVESKRRKRDDDDDDLNADNLDDEDLDLIEENIGVKLDRKKKFKRLKIDDEDSDVEADVQGQIRREIFEGSGDEEAEEEEEGGAAPHPPQQPETYASEEEEEDSDDEGNFIVDDDGQPIAKQKRKAVFEDEGLEAARDIFGCDFDYGEFETYEDWEEGEEEEEEEEDEDYDEDEEGGEGREKRRSRKERKKAIKKSIYEVFEPSELERGHLTDQDQQIRKLDIPERFQLRQITVTRTRTEVEEGSDKELDQEAKWIYHHAFFKPFISNQEGRDERRHRRDINIIKKIHNALDLIRNTTCEVPFIAFYRKEEVQPELNIHDLWKVYRWDEKWCQLQHRKENLRLRFKAMSEFQGDLVMRDLDAPLPDTFRLLSEEDIEKIDEIETSEQFNDCYKLFLLYYGKDQADMRAHIKAKRKMKKITKRVTRTVKVLKKIKRKKKKKNHLIIEDDDDEDRDNDKASQMDVGDNEPAEVERADDSDEEKSEKGDEDKSEKGDDRSEKGDDRSEKGDDDRSEKGDDDRSDKGDDDRSEKGDDDRSERGDDDRSEKGDDEDEDKSEKGDEEEKSESAVAKKLNDEDVDMEDVEQKEKDDEEKDDEEKDDEEKDDEEKDDKENDEDKDDEDKDDEDEDDEDKDDEDQEKEDGMQDKEKEDDEIQDKEKDAEEIKEKSKSKVTEDDDEDSTSEEEVETEVEEEIEEEEEVDESEEEIEDLKKAVRRHEYELLRKAGIDTLAKKFGLTSDQFSGNVRDGYQRFDVDQCDEEPLEEAEKFMTKMCNTPERVLEAAVRMVGWQLACEPVTRRTIRENYFERAKINIRPTQHGKKLIDEHHPLYALKHVTGKPVTDLQGDQFLRLKCGVEDKLLTISFSDVISGNNNDRNYLEELKQLYYRDEFSKIVQDWNELRGRAVSFAYKRIIEDLKRELSQRLLEESRLHVIEQCCSKLYNWIKVGPYNPGDFTDEDEDDWDTSKGFRVFSIAYVPDLSQAAFGCCIDIDGDCCEYIRLPHLLKRRDAYNERDAMAKESDIRRLQDFIIRRKPHVVAVSGESREAVIVQEDLTIILKDLEEQEQFPKVNVEIIENDLSDTYSISKKGEADFLDYPPLLRQAISIGRRVQDPLIEFSQLCNPDEELLNLKFHSLQSQLTDAELLEALYIEFVNRTNEVGVDLNRAVAYPYTQNLVQFICGLGPRKANLLMKNMKQNNQRLENRNQLVVNFHMGPKVFINCAGFIKIDTNALGDSDNYIEVLDSTRIHPEAYDWARKMAVDALEYEDEEGKPAEALEEILETPDRLSELDLEAFAIELQNQGFGKKSTTLYDIRHELNYRYKDFRTAYQSPTADEVFNMLTKESPETFYVGKLVQVTVTNFIHRKPRGDQLDNANPVRNEETGLWQCPFCLKNDFPELSEVWNHFDAGDCPGQSIGIKVRLDNGITGFISIKNLSDKTVTNPAERVKRRGLVLCRIMKIDPEKFSVELTSRTSDLQDRDNKWKAPKDPYYDHILEEDDMTSDRQKKEKKKTQYQKRVIAHPAFRNIDYNEAEKVMQQLEQGDIIIRPSSKGNDHLTATWKVSEGICQHIDIQEQDKQNDFSLGQKLWIGNEEFEDLDEIITRHILPMASNTRQILEYKYYKESMQGNKEKAKELLFVEKKKNSKTIPYVFSARKDLPGKFMLSYLPRDVVKHEFVTVNPEGFRFRGKLQYSSLAGLLKWFKINFRRAIPTTPGMVSTRTPYMTGTTPNIMGVDPSTIQKVAQNLNPHMLHNLSQAATNTPYGGQTPGAFSQGYSNYANTPYTPSGQTPFMTPYTTPGPSNTPRYGGSQTPSYGNAGNRTPSHRPSGGMTPQHSRSMPSASSRSEQMDWKMAAQAWVQAKGGNSSSNMGRSTPRHHEGGRTTPRYMEPRDNRYQSSSGYQEEGGRHTPRYGNRTPRSYHDYDNPRANSARSTPKTIHSPTNMSIGGDQTPLYDE